VGTLGAICGSYVMYMSFMFLWAGVGSRAYLQQDHGQIETLLFPSVAAAQVGILSSSL
jgi:potassium/chloride transporter 4/5/6